MTITACQRSTARLYSQASARRQAQRPRELFQSPMSAHLGTGSRPSAEELDRPLRRTTQCIVSASPPSHRGGARLRGGPSSSARSGFICFRCAALTQAAPHKRGGSSVSDRPAPTRAGRLRFWGAAGDRPPTTARARGAEKWSAGVTGRGAGAKEGRAARSAELDRPPRRTHGTVSASPPSPSGVARLRGGAFQPALLLPSPSMKAFSRPALGPARPGAGPLRPAGAGAAGSRRPGSAR